MKISPFSATHQAHHSSQKILSIVIAQSVFIYILHTVTHFGGICVVGTGLEQVFKGSKTKVFGGNAYEHLTMCELTEAKL